MDWFLFNTVTGKCQELSPLDAELLPIIMDELRHYGIDLCHGDALPFWPQLVLLDVDEEFTVDVVQMYDVVRRCYVEQYVVGVA